MPAKLADLEALRLPDFVDFRTLSLSESSSSSSSSSSGLKALKAGTNTWQYNLFL
jgi:hypothetical protein